MEELGIHFLGTGSARPSLQRSTAAVVLTYGGDGLLFDCGEGTQVQFARSNVRSSRLRAIFITHFHGDHINGLPGLVGTMGLNGHEEPITLSGPRGLDRYLATLRKLSILRPSFPVNLVENEERTVYETSRYRVTSCPLKHRVPTHGFLFEEFDLPGRFDVARAEKLRVPRGPMWGRLQNGSDVELADGTVVAPSDVLGETRKGRRVAYISDTVPTDEIVDFVRGVDVLIHESTYLHEDARMARKRGHSTARQAAEVAADAGVKQLILTHYSTKYMRTGPLKREACAVFPNTVAAQDLSEFTVGVP